MTVNLLIEATDGVVETRPLRTRMEAVVVLQCAMEECGACRRLTISEDARRVYSVSRTSAGWREDVLQ
jgi:hypothetical protein